MTVEIFESILLNGQVAVIRGAASHWPLAHWTCLDFRTHPEMEPVERVYGETDGVFVDRKTAWETDQRPSENLDRDGPQFAPLYWSVKASDSSSQFIHEQTPTLDFIRGGNLWWKFHAAEIWFSPPSAGAKSHVDSHMQSTMVTQLVGTRRWRLAGVPAAESPSLMQTHGDSADFSWVPEITLILQTGDALIFPPGSIHDTLNLSNATCAASITHQYGSPLPYKYFRRHLHAFQKIGDLAETWPLFADLVSLGFLLPRLTVEPPFFNSTSLPFDEANPVPFFREIFSKFPETPKKYFWFHDVDGDGQVSESEFLSTAMEWFKTELGLIEAFPAQFRVYRYFRELVEKSATDEFFDNLWNFQSNGFAKPRSVVDEL